MIDQIIRGKVELINPCPFTWSLFVAIDKRAQCVRMLLSAPGVEPAYRIAHGLPRAGDTAYMVARREGNHPAAFQLKVAAAPLWERILLLASIFPVQVVLFIGAVVALSLIVGLVFLPFIIVIFLFVKV